MSGALEGRPRTQSAPRFDDYMTPEERAAFGEKLRWDPKPRAAVEGAPSHWPGTIAGCIAIMCLGAVTMACAGLLGGGFA